MKKIATIILNYNTPKQTCNIAMHMNRLGYFVVVVDNCSSDNSVEIISEKFNKLQNCELICSKLNTGYAKGNNIGILFAQKKWDIDYIAVMNPDIELLHDSTIENLCQALEDDEDLAGITALTLFNENMKADNPCASRLLTPVEMIFSDLYFFNSFIEKNYKELKGNNQLVAYVDKIQGCFFIMKLEHFKKIGFFDEHTFLYYEEDIIGYKIKCAGYKLGVLLSETICHNHGIKDSEMQNKSKRLFYNKCLLDSKRYYMLHVLKTKPIIWKISYVLDSVSRKLKDIRY